MSHPINYQLGTKVVFTDECDEERVGVVVHTNPPKMKGHLTVAPEENQNGAGYYRRPREIRPATALEVRLWHRLYK